MEWLGFYVGCAYVTAVLVVVLTLASAVTFMQREHLCCRHPPDLT